MFENNGSTGKTVTGSKGAYVLRYATCLMIMLFVPWVLLSLISNDDNTILRKLVESREYAVKVLILEICIMLAYTIVNCSWKRRKPVNMRRFTVL